MHLQTSTSTVKCGAPMSRTPDDGGWDLGNVTTELRKVTCPACRPQYRPWDDLDNPSQCGGPRGVTAK